MSLPPYRWHYTLTTQIFWFKKRNVLFTKHLLFFYHKAALRVLRQLLISLADKSPNGDVLTCSGTNHPALFTNNFTLMDLSLPVEGLFEISEDDVLSVFVRLYHRSPVIPGNVDTNDLKIYFVGSTVKFVQCKNSCNKKNRRAYLLLDGQTNSEFDSWASGGDLYSQGAIWTRLGTER